MAQRITDHMVAVRALRFAAELDAVFYDGDKKFQKWVAETGSLKKHYTADYREAIGLQAFVIHSVGLGQWQLARFSGDSGGIRTFGPSMKRSELYDALSLMEDVLYFARPPTSRDRARRR